MALLPFIHIYIFVQKKKIQGGFSSWVLNEYHVKIQSQSVDKPTLEAKLHVLPKIAPSPPLLRSRMLEELFLCISGSSLLNI